MLLDVVGVILVVADTQGHARLLTVWGNRHPALPPAPAARFQRALLCQQFQRGPLQIGDDRPAHLHCIVLLGHRTEIGQVVGAIINAADKTDFAIDHQNLAVQAAKQVGAHAQALRARVEGLQMHTGIAELTQVVEAQVSGAIAVNQHLDFHPAPGGSDQQLLQLLADLVFIDDEGFQEDLGACLFDGGEGTGEVILAIDQQLHLVVGSPMAVHRSTSTAKGR